VIILGAHGEAQQTIAMMLLVLVITKFKLILP
jgi:hypothetical protein